MRYMVAAKPEDILKADMDKPAHPSPHDYSEAEEKAEKEWEAWESKKASPVLGDDWLLHAARGCKAEVDVNTSESIREAEVEAFLDSLNLDTLSDRDKTLSRSAIYARARGVDTDAFGKAVEASRRDRYHMMTAPIQDKNTVEASIALDIEGMFL